MKEYVIGRDAGCDIVINDSSQVVSRRHAVIKVSSTGKMTITDVSNNGTFINGVRIAKNIPYPVTRKDRVTFAQFSQLGWNAIPNPLWYLKYVILGVLAVIAIVIAVIAFMPKRHGGYGGGGGGAVENTDNGVGGSSAFELFTIDSSAIVVDTAKSHTHASSAVSTVGANSDNGSDNVSVDQVNEDVVVEGDIKPNQVEVKSDPKSEQQQESSNEGSRSFR